MILGALLSARCCGNFPWEFPEILGEDLFVNWYLGFPRGSHKCCQGVSHLQAHAWCPRDSQKDQSVMSSQKPSLGTPTTTWELCEPLLGPQHSGGPSRGLRHPAWSIWGRIQEIWGLQPMGPFYPQAQVHFDIHFDTENSTPPPTLGGQSYYWGLAILFFEVTIKTCWPGSHFNPVWWPCISQLCSIRQKVAI